MTARTSATLALLGLLLLVLSACGFKLRGQAQLPAQFQLVFIELDQRITPTSPLVNRLRQLLQLNGATLTESQQQASARIILSDEAVRRRTLALGVQGDAREFTLSYSVVVKVLGNADAVLLPPTPLSVSRNLLYRETELLGSLEGERLALRELADELANVILQRLQSLQTG